MLLKEQTTTVQRVEYRMIYYRQKVPANTQGDANEIQRTTVERVGNKLHRTENRGGT